jgi:hypothetical protein
MYAVTGFRRIPTKEQRDAGIGFGAVEYGYQTLGKLAQFLGVS